MAKNGDKMGIEDDEEDGENVDENVMERCRKAVDEMGVADCRGSADEMGMEMVLPRGEMVRTMDDGYDEKSFFLEEVNNEDVLYENSVEFTQILRFFI